MVISFSCIFIFGYLAYTVARDNGLTAVDILKRAEANIRNSDVFRRNTNYVKVAKNEVINATDIDNIVINSDNINVMYLEEKSDGKNIIIEFEGDINQELVDDFFGTEKTSGTLNVNAYTRNNTNPTANGITMIVRVSKGFEGDISIINENGDTMVKSSSVRNLYIDSISGNSELYITGSDTILNAISESGNMKIDSDNYLNSNINTKSGNISMVVSSLSGYITSESGNINIDFNILKNDLNIETVEGDITVVSPKKYNYDITSGTGYIEAYDQDDLATQLNFNKAIYDYYINVWTQSGNVVFNYKD